MKHLEMWYDVREWKSGVALGINMKMYVFPLELGYFVDIERSIQVAYLQKIVQEIINQLCFYLK